MNKHLRFSLVFLFSLLVIPTTSLAQTIPAGGEFEIEIDETIAIYGQRDIDCGPAPTFEWALKKAVTRKPKYGNLTDGGTGERESGKCGKEVPVRIINYTPDQEKALKRAKKKKKNVIKDRVNFWRKDKAIIFVETE
mgnify:CR=1 FL=1